MTNKATQRTDTNDLAALSRGLAIVVGGGVVTLSAAAWGPSGLRASALGAALSVLNVFVLTRVARQAVATAAAGGPNTAIVHLTGALAGKTALLLVAAWIVLRFLDGQALPFALGLLVAAFALLGAGLLTALRAE
jgi:hypothetical protein